ncbi:hypothetical protein TWF569_008290 [Orbilia oligospora]|uniref:Uncharacterized protein n=1 Tax=Orbilia oligospora TaxID=2813651 RepID=A0A7C8JD33_ORBOL|nr:hypothetical protein TWF706_006155 [Orbilia oligospora]KAF3112043.1 hypothetical protein TWF102_005790 [Orbilia oligospora]KAF3113276.1 hypothetical protein TWF103_002441 [Orbilia oligospora]KAF3140149.1 hypothetical protein TWF569_008290 [Orbilia oligospora]KAF3147439.1 hypothetical protein TWF594_002659 [Orbilia oligospora]
MRAYAMHIKCRSSLNPRVYMLRMILSWVTLPAKISSPSRNNKGIGRLSCRRAEIELLGRWILRDDCRKFKHGGDNGFQYLRRKNGRKS